MAYMSFLLVRKNYGFWLPSVLSELGAGKGEVRALFDLDAWLLLPRNVTAVSARQRCQDSKHTVPCNCVAAVGSTMANGPCSADTDAWHLMVSAQAGLLGSTFEI
eukprot:1406597-Pleurochrysis_carterae.AAC.3